MKHLSPEQFVDIAEGAVSDADVPHLRACGACRRELADVRAMQSAVADPDAAGAPEPSPLFWDHLSARVRQAVSDEQRNPERDVRALVTSLLSRPRALVPALAALAALLVAVALPRQTLKTMKTTIPSTPLAIATHEAVPPSPPPIPPLGKADDPQLRMVAASGTAMVWDEMREEMAVAAPGGSADVIVGTLTPDEQRALQRLLADEMTQPSTLEDRS